MVIELSRVQFGLKSYTWFQNRMSVQRKFDLKSLVWFQTKIARHEVQSPLYCIHFWNRPNTGLGQFKHFIDAVLSRSENSSISWGEKVRVLETKVAKFATWYSVFHFPAIWSVTLNKPWNLIGRFVFSVASPLPGKKVRFKAKNGAIRK